MLSPNLWLQETWAQIATTYSPLQIEITGTVVVQLLTFYLPCAIYMSLPKLFPAFSERHKLQKQEKQPTRAQILDAVFVVSRNQLIAFGIQFLGVWIRQQHGLPCIYDVSPTFPTLQIFVRDFAIALIIREALFYYLHRLFHAKRLYPYIHKIHHRFTAPVALAAQYAHPVEHILVNVLPVVLPNALLRSHILTFWAFLAAMLIETSTVHSGYDFWPHLAEKHDRHHEVFIWNFGACLDWFDWMHGTKEKQKVQNAFTDRNEKKKS
ncbi:SubName: Full=Related to C-4 methyl sterol oxidase {ECO:0000313/EMBL:CCA68111.1} [Serendipita indica DSM 11827]|uniref:Related to C-4 methyl sterol oxidase n=1 Tax=Serendipita indica (strain DSM 11827) TaxID=1109443 RepID=G4T9W5_SERID|nr:SubName: Full=Related to C-4 methyl sterol oxidase {ECO:0000313/EMBL:CCA68111.1} [Serendipita indica DSM 11827]CCA68111.1 related to C-4 methyl sterol oxidase [Serendipita indica DSM 11827]